RSTRHPPPSPTRRSSDLLDTNNSYAAGWGEILALSAIGDYILGTLSNAGMSSNVGYDRYGRAQLLTRVTYAISPTLSLSARVNRSEEHTSELQSPCNLVC